MSVLECGREREEDIEGGYKVCVRECERERVIQVEIGEHPPIPIGSS